MPFRVAFKIIFSVSILSFLLLKTQLQCSDRIQAVVFDFGGVVAQVDRSEALRFLATSFKCTEKEARDVLKALIQHLASGGNEEKFWKAYLSKKGETLRKEWYLQWKTVPLFSHTEIPGTLEIIQELKMQGFKVPLLSNARKDQVEYIRKLGYYELFEPVLVSSEIGFEKPSLQAYQALLRELKLPARVCLFIDDRQENVEAAKRVGLDAIHFVDSQQLILELAKRNIFVSLPEIQLSYL